MTSVSHPNVVIPRCTSQGRTNQCIPTEGDSVSSTFPCGLLLIDWKQHSPGRVMNWLEDLSHNIIRDLGTDDRSAADGTGLVPNSLHAIVAN